MSARLWDDSCHSHLVILVGHAKIDQDWLDTEGRELSVTISVSSSVEKRSSSTAARRCLVSPDTAIWNEVVSFELPPRYARTALGDDPTDYPTLMIEVRAKKLVGWQTIGFTDLDSKQLTLDTLTYVDKKLRCDKVKRKGGKGGKGGKGEKREQNIAGRLVFSAYVTQKRMFPDRSSSLSSPAGVVYPFEGNMDRINPGDIVLYNKSGPYSAIYHTAFGTFWTHCGIVVPVLDEITGIDQLCVFEYGSNFEGSASVLLPSSDNTPVAAPALFPLKSRIREFLGAEAWLLPLEKALTEAETQKLVKWAKRTVVNFSSTKKELLQRKEFNMFPFTKSQESFLSKFGLKVTERSFFADFYSANFIVLALEAVGREMKKMGTFATLVDITNSDLYKIPILLRARNEIADNLFWPNQPPKTEEKKEESEESDGSESSESSSDEASDAGGKGSQKSSKKDSQKSGKKKSTQGVEEAAEKISEIKKSGDKSDTPRVSIGFIGESDSEGSINMDEYDDDDDETNYSSFLQSVNQTRNGSSLSLRREDSQVPAGMVVPASVSDLSHKDDYESDEEEKNGSAEGSEGGDDDDDDINDEDYL